MMKTVARRCGWIALGILVDRALPEPPTPVHPVAWFGKTMRRTEHLIWADRRSNGIAYAALGAGIGAIVGRAMRSPMLAVAISAAGPQLRSVALAIKGDLDAGDLDRARANLPMLVGRDPSTLDEPGVAAAVVESVAENSVDAIVAPVFWAVFAGAPGATAYRAINTMDAMVGHHNERYERFGWAAARLDDIANYLPARAFAALVAITRPSRIRDIVGWVRSDAPAHPSPNAVIAETAMAAALGCELGGPLRYGQRVERRPRLGAGPRPRSADIARATKISDRVELTMVVGLAVVRTVWSMSSRRRRPHSHR